MPDDPNQPQSYDAVLGGQTPIPEGSAILGGIEGVKWRLESAIEEQRIVALSEALKYGEAGLELIIMTLQDESWKVEKTAYRLLKERTEPRVKQALKKYNYWNFLRCLRTFNEYKDVYSVAISSDGQTIFTASYDDHGADFRDMRLCLGSFNFSTGYSQELFRCFEYNVNSAAISSDGQTLINGNYGNIRIRHFPAEEVIRDIQGHSDHLNSLAIGLDGNIIASSADSDKNIKIWQLETGELIKTLEGHIKQVTAVGISPDGQIIVSGSYDKTIKIWHLETGELIKTLNIDFFATSIAVSPDGQTLVSGHKYGTIKIWCLKTGELLRTLEEHSDRVTSIAISLDGQTLVSGSWDGSIKVWRVP
jgi:COMPASS component SWD3